MHACQRKCNEVFEFLVLTTWLPIWLTLPGFALTRRSWISRTNPMYDTSKIVRALSLLFRFITTHTITRPNTRWIDLYPCLPVWKSESLRGLQPQNFKEVKIAQLAEQSKTQEPKLIYSALRRSIREKVVYVVRNAKNIIYWNMDLKLYSQILTCPDDTIPSSHSQTLIPLSNKK